MPTSVALTPHFESYTKHLVATGRYNNVSEVIRDSLRLHEEKLKQEDTRLKALLGAVQLGMDDFDAGRVVSFSSAKQFGAHLKAMRAGKTAT
jgi:putative addiction module CopG family antidote